MEEAGNAGEQREDRVLEKLLTFTSFNFTILNVDPHDPDEIEDNGRPFEGEREWEYADQELLLRLGNHNHHWYRRAMLSVPDEYWGPEYTPTTRWIPLFDLRDDWYHEVGIPHEVSSRTGNRFMPFKFWMVYVARTWWRPLEDVIVPGSVEATGGIYSQGRISFFRVMKIRIAWQKHYAIFTQIAGDKFNEALGYVSPNKRIPARVRVERRIDQLGFGLTGLSWISLMDKPDQIWSLKHFVRSAMVRKPFEEYVESWLQHFPRSRNPKWNIIQSSLHNQRLCVALLNRRYGFGDPWQAPFLDKAGWSHEDHACRFIMTVYRLGREFLVREFDDVNAPNINLNTGWRRYFFSVMKSPDMEDKYWFGFALLWLLMKSWQSCQQFPYWPVDLYEEYLIPALYDDFAPLEYEFPRPDVGQLDLSPESEWLSWDPYQPSFNWQIGGMTGMVEWYRRFIYLGEESNTAMLDDGIRGHTTLAQPQVEPWFGIDIEEDSDSSVDIQSSDGSHSDVVTISDVASDSEIEYIPLEEMDN